ncbi:MAG: phosphatidate cytidylyltransferase [Muribaculaceae bacterium]|nr:phosphatidate cytidylyltransferase [Muribaculaceae bacterium]
MNVKTLAVRTGGGLIYCLIVLIALLCGSEGALVLAALLSALACTELTRMSNGSVAGRLPALLLDIAGCICLCLGFMVYPIAIWVGVMICRMIEELYLKSDTPMRDLGVSMISQVWIGVPMAIMVAVSYLLDSRLILAVFFLLWINDTAAFLSGSLFGRHKLFERISPKKTWEGFLGGLIITLAASAIFGVFCNDWFYLSAIGANVATWIGLGAVVVLFGTWGDLIESLMKRNLHTKDSGNLIPGHGGILDRIDSLLLALPAAAIYLFIIAVI